MQYPSVHTPHPNSDDRVLPPVLFAVMMLLIGAAHFVAQWRLPTPFCWLRTLTGIPCPGCGSTRCFLALSNFHVAQAFRFNPMMFLVCVGVVVWFMAWTADLLLKRGWTSSIYQRFRRLPFAVIIPIGILLNWVYLCFALPR